jgi:chorismate--pyruvate lyase
LTVLQTNRYHPAEANWQDFHRYTARELPSQIRPWLLDSGSLTQRLIKSSSDHFAVQVLKQEWQRPRLSEVQLLNMQPREMAIIREVALLCHGQPWVFARSVIPATSLHGHLRRLRKLNNSSLGALLFSAPSMHRAPFQLAKLNGFNHQLPQSLQQNADLWGRRSRFELSGKAIMVSELFLQAFKP